MKPTALIPSMFHRRLTLLTTTIVILMLVLVGKLYLLTVVHGLEMREEALRVLVDRRPLETTRGRIIDRRGRVLAWNRPTFDVLVDYRLITGAWAETEAGVEAKRADPELWRRLSRRERQKLQDTLKPRYERELERMWRELADLGDVNVQEIQARCQAIQKHVEKMAQAVWERWRREREAELQIQLTIEDVNRPIREQRMPHIILAQLDPAVEAEFRRLADRSPHITIYNSTERPGITIRPAGARDYPWEKQTITLDRSTMPAPLRSDDPLPVTVQGVARYLIGSMRPSVFREEFRARPFIPPDPENPGTPFDLGGYRADDPIGSRGIERAREPVLRGSRGFITRRLDSGQEIRRAPLPGEDVQLTLDIALQGRVQALLAPEVGLTRVQPWHSQDNQLPLGTHLKAAVVVIEIESGDILAMVSTPAGTEWTVYRDREGNETVGKARINRANSVPYACGSIVKPLILCSGVSQGVWNLNRLVQCNGSYFESDREHFRCWIYRPPNFAVHGPLAAVEAIGRSCNIFFHTIASELGPHELVKWYRRWGLGREFDLGVTMFAGMIRDPDQLDRSQVLMMGIGQTVAWTPLHAANAFATLARGGLYFDPRLIADDGSGSADRRTRIDLGLDDRVVDAAMRGLFDVVNNQEYGGARHIDVDPDPQRRQFEPIFNVQGVNVWGKTGTAQAQRPERRLVLDHDAEPIRDNDGKPIIEDQPRLLGTHSWFVGLVGTNREGLAAHQARPAYAISVLVEWGGSGSRCATPIANQVIHALVEEGYL